MNPQIAQRIANTKTNPPSDDALADAMRPYEWLGVCNTPLRD